MSPSLTSDPLTSIDLQRLRASSDPSIPTTKHMPSTPIDVSLLTPFSNLQYSNTPSPPNFITAELTSENSFFSEIDYTGDDEYYGVDFDTAEQVTTTDSHLLDNRTLQPTKVPNVDAYALHQPGNTAQSSETATNSTYPMSRNQSSPHSTHSPKSEPHEPQRKMTASQHEASGGVHAAQESAKWDIPVSVVTPHEMQDYGSNSYNIAEHIGLGVVPPMGHSPRVTITPWESTQAQEIPTEIDQGEQQFTSHSALWHIVNTQDGSLHQHFTHMHDMCSSVSGESRLNDEQNALEAQGFDGANGRVGVNPDRRKSLSDVEIPNFKEQEEHARLRAKNMEVEEWRSQAGDSTEADDEILGQIQPTLTAPGTNIRRRARTTGEIPHQFANARSMATPSMVRDSDEGRGIEPVSDTESVRDNQLKEGQIYFNPKATEVSDADRRMMQQSRHWDDAPAYQHMIDTKLQPATANDAVRKWNEIADNFSLLSRSATWGTRRRSEPSIAEIESIHTTSFLKRLSFGKSREKRPSPGTLLKDSFEQLTSIVRKKSDSKLKRSRSDRDGRGRPDGGVTIKKEAHASLAPPPGSLGGRQRGASSPRLNTNLGNSPTPGFASSGSVSATATSPKGTFGFMGSVIRRARSGSNLQQDPPGSTLADLWKQAGGPPVPTLASPPLDNEPIKTLDYSDMDGDDDDEEEMVDDGEKMDFDQVTPITRNFAGFQEHVLRLFPYMEQGYLVDRIAHHQVVRYKTLLNWRVKHSGAVATNSCSAGHHCIASGGAATILEGKGQALDKNPANGGLQTMTDISDGDSNPEDVLAPESFPQGVPMPPAQNLPAEFECQLCFRVKKFKKPSDWTKHVHEDVQPFTCTYSNCKEPKSFKRKADWVRHENERHRHLGWWTCTVDDCTHKCYRKDNFVQHLVREHKLPEPKQKTKAAARKARNSDEPVWRMIRECHHETTARPQDEPCKFCGKVLLSWKKLTVHLAKHMEHISLSVLRLVEEQQVDANTIISPVEALPIRQSPLTPVGGERRASNSSGQYCGLSASMSPNPSSMPHFSSPIYPQTSPSAQQYPQFQNMMYGPNMGYSSTPTGQDMSYNMLGPIPQHQPGIMFDNNGSAYNNIDTMGTHLNHAANYTPMSHSPSVEPVRGFTTINGVYTAPMNDQQGYHSYASSNTTLSPDPASFVSAPQQMPGFRAQTIGPNQGLQGAFSTGHHQGSGFNAPQMTGQMSAPVDGGSYGFQSINTVDNGLGFGEQMPMMREHSGGGYPPTSSSGYRYQGQ